MTEVQPIPVTVSQYSYYSDKNYPKRRTMEDAHVICDPLIEVEGRVYSLYAIFDGHRGRTAAQHCAKIVKDKIKEVLQRKDEGFEEMMQDAMYEMDMSLKENGIEYSGCCALMCIIEIKEKKRIIHMANCGDSCGIIIGTNEVIPMSEEHKATNENEAQRIKESGGMIINGRVSGDVAVTRGLGDHHLKQWVVSEPFVKEVEWQEDYKYIVLGCDGLWDTLNGKQIKEVLESNNCEFTSSAKSLTQLAIGKGSTDNITTIVLKL
ncbi:protein phosphatase, putative [Entamoeba nuttalli P19]|uniref:Protein phosphatase, putative n=1 Tax=Entamoeba nuttalli (strain P19) TaxID=1076696 RepID=K2H395_ENTNP|nr:protein phosphatase, putative [Entamoeba nuttalli P19]EKE41968.1 protein phosphatase, putative [Entamoeba nuttalli P19]|eukprot:XP_008855696.1 protein phosphatase, putative [Entamoeba nuttalli P19]